MILLLVLLSLVASPQVVRAATVVTDCANFGAANGLGPALSAAGAVTFNCGGTGPFTIIVPSEQEITSNTSIDGADGGRNDVTLSGNDATRLFAVHVNATLSIINLTIVHGKALLVTVPTFIGTPAGAIVNLGGTLVITNSTFDHNAASGNGGAIVTTSNLDCDDVNFPNPCPLHVGGKTTISNSSFTFNSAGNQSGAIQIFALTRDGSAEIPGNTLTIINSVFNHNTAGGSGGAVDQDGGVLSVSGSVFANSTSGSFGGALHIDTQNSGMASINSSTFTGNTATSDGGGIDAFNGSPPSITNSTFATNHADGVGGAVNGAANIVNSTFSGNTATGAGGALDSDDGASTIINSTFSGNSAPSGGAIKNDFGTLTVTNTILANSPSGGNCAGIAVTDGGGNLDDGTTCGFGVASLSSTPPLLGPLASNGGPTQTFALLTGSPAINAGSPSGCTDANGNALTTDQRGFPRPDTWSGLCDIGAFELQACTILATVLGPTTAGLTSRLGVANVPNRKNPLMYITFQLGGSNFVARFTNGTFGCVNQGKSNATALLTGVMDSAHGSAFAHGDGVTVFLQLQNTAGITQVDVTDTKTGVTYTIKGPLSFGSSIVIK